MIGDLHFLPSGWHRFGVSGGSGMRLGACATIALVAVASLFASAGNAAPCRLADLRWIAGAWRDDSADARTEERWVVGPDDRLVGAAWTLHPGAGGGVIEAMTLQNDGANVVMRLRHFSGDLAMAREEKDAPMVFVASACGDRSVVLDGRGERAGEHMTYERAGDTLTFIGDFIHEGQPLRVRVGFKKSGD